MQAGLFVGFFLFGFGCRFRVFRTAASALAFCLCVVRFVFRHFDEVFFFAERNGCVYGCRRQTFVIFGFGFVLVDFVENRVSGDTEDKCGCYGSDGDIVHDFAVACDFVRNSDAESADTGNEYCADDEEVFVFAEVDVFEHLKTADCDETVKSEANAAHYAGRNGLQQAHDGAEEGQHYAHAGGYEDGSDGCVAGDCDAAYGFTVSGVGADTENRTHNGADAVAEQSAFESGFAFDEVAVDDGAEVLVVCDVFRKDDECNGDKRECDFGNTLSVENDCFGICGNGARFARDDFFDCFDECEIGVVEESGDADEGTVRINKVVDDVREVDYLELFHVERVTERGEYSRKCVSCADTDDEGYELEGFVFLLSGADYDGKEGHKTAKQCNEVVAGVDGCGRRFDHIAHCVCGKRKTDECDGGADDDGRHEFGDPFGAREVNDDCKNYVNETREYSTEDYSEVSEGKRAAESGEESKGAAEEYGAFAAGEQQIDQRADACAEDSGGNLRGQTDDGRHRNSSCEYSKQLLNGEYEQFAKRRFVIDVVNEFHLYILPE